MTETYDVVLTALQTKHDELASMAGRNIKILGRNIMDDIRLEQCDQLKEAMCVWEAHKRGDTI